MKYLRKYESFKYIYWIVDLTKPDPYFEVCLDKLGVDDEHKHTILYDKKIYSEGLNTAAIVKVSKNGWQFSMHEIMNSIGGDYMGEIKASEKEIKDYKIKKESEKYNL